MTQKATPAGTTQSLNYTIMSTIGAVAEISSLDDKLTKMIRSQTPDVIASVGLGNSAQEFQCYKVILSFAPEYLDTMLGSSMKEGTLSKIEFPDKDPEEWKLFYKFTTSQMVKKSEHNNEINNENVLTLVLWFHEFRMVDSVQECGGYLATN